jgi:hypothetical protein
VIEVTFVPEVTYDTPPPVRRFVLEPQATTRIDEVLASTFGIGAGRGAFRVETFGLPGTPPATLAASAVVRAASDPDGSEGAAVSALPEASWTNAGKQILDIPFGTTTSATLVVANLDEIAGTVSFDLTDASGAYIGSGVLELAARTSRLRSLADLFRNLSQRPAPFKATFAPAGIRFSAAALVTGPASTRVRVLAAATLP